MERNGFIKELILNFSERGDAHAFDIFDGNQVSRVTYGQFAQDILKTAGYLADRELTGKHIALAAPSSYRWLVTFFALSAAGNTVIPLNPDLPDELMQWQCHKADISLVCYSNPKTAEKLGQIPTVSLDAMCGEVPMAMERVYDHTADETVLMMFTSGTTGKSKTVVMSDTNLYISVTNAAKVFLSREENRSHIKKLISLPLFHIGSIRMSMEQLYNGNPLAIGRGTRYIFMDAPRLNPTHIDMVPAIAESYVRILRGTAPEKLVNYVGNALKGIAVVGASMKTGVAKYLLDKIEITVVFGMTETTGDGSWCILDEAHLGTIGKPAGDIAFRIQDGEILLKSEGITKGYYKDPEETAKVIVDGWLHTGDMGRCDEDGYYYITGRKKNVIILSNGENVNPEEIEATLGDCDAITECLVYSDGKGICADVFAAEQEAAAAFISSYNSTMPKYRQIYKVNYSAEPLPKTGSGKLKRKENL